MTLVDDRRPAASGTTSPTDPPPDLSNVDDAQQFYLAGSYWHKASPIRSVATRAVHYVVSRPGDLAHLRARLAGQLLQLHQLRPGWDGRSAQPITQEAIYAAALVMDRVLDEDSEVPQLFPLPSGGVQVEWYADDEIEIEIEIDRAGEAHVLATAANGEILAEGTFDPHTPSELAAATAQLVKNLSANVAMRRRNL